LAVGLSFFAQSSSLDWAERLISANSASLRLFPVFSPRRRRVVCIPQTLADVRRTNILGLFRKVCVGPRVSAAIILYSPRRHRGRRERKQPLAYFGRLCRRNPVKRSIEHGHAHHGEHCTKSESRHIRHRHRNPQSPRSPHRNVSDFFVGRYP